MLRSAYKHFSCLNLAEVTSKNHSKLFKVAPVDGTTSLKIYSLREKAQQRKKQNGRLREKTKTFIFYWFSSYV